MSTHELKDAIDFLVSTGSAEAIGVEMAKAIGAEIAKALPGRHERIATAMKAAILSNRETVQNYSDLGWSIDAMAVLHADELIAALDKTP